MAPSSIPLLAPAAIAKPKGEERGEEGADGGVSSATKVAITKLNRSLNLGFSNLNLLYDALAKDDPLMSFLGKAVADMNICSFMHAHFITTSARTEGWKNVALLQSYRDSLRDALDNVLAKLLPGGGRAFLDRIAKRVVTALREGLEQGPSLRAICAPTTGIAAYCR